MVRWLYDYRGQPSVGTVLPVMQRLARRERRGPRLAHPGEGARGRRRSRRSPTRLRARVPQLEVNSVADLVAHFRERLVYFRQLSYILGAHEPDRHRAARSRTLLTITVNERLGEIATLRAIGVSRGDGRAPGAGRGHRADRRRRRARHPAGPGHGALPRRHPHQLSRTSRRRSPSSCRGADTLAFAAVVLLVTGSLAGLYPAWLASRAPIAATLRAEAT